MSESIRERLAKQAAREAIAQAEYEIHKSYNSKLENLIVDAVGGLTGMLIGKPRPPKKSATLLRILVDYADELYRHRMKYHTGTLDKTAVATEVENEIVRRIRQMELMGHSLHYHSSETEIRESILETLKELSTILPVTDAAVRNLSNRTISQPRRVESPIAVRARQRNAFVEPILRKKGMTRSKWAIRSGVDPSVIYDYLSGKSSPRPESRNLMAEAIGIQERDLPE